MRFRYNYTDDHADPQLMCWNGAACPDRHREPLLAHDYPHQSVYTYMGSACPDRYREPPVNLVDPDCGRAH